MTKVLIPSGEAAFQQLRDGARRTAGQGPAPKPTTSTTPDRRPAPAAPGPKLEAPGSRTPEDPRPRPAAPASSSGREQPARAAEKTKAGETPELEPAEELDIQDLFFFGGRK